MKLTNFSIKELANLSLRCFIQQSLPGKMLKGLKVHVSGSLLPPPPQPDRAERCLNRDVDLAARLLPCVQVIVVRPSPLLP